MESNDSIIDEEMKEKWEKRNVFFLKYPIRPFIALCILGIAQEFERKSGVNAFVSAQTIYQLWRYTNGNLTVIGKIFQNAERENKGLPATRLNTAAQKYFGVQTKRW